MADLIAFLIGAGMALLAIGIGAALAWRRGRLPPVYPACAETGAPKDPRGCWNVRCQLGGVCCRAPGVAPAGPLQQAAAGMRALDEGHDALCMAVLRGKDCTCGVREDGNG